MPRAAKPAPRTPLPIAAFTLSAIFVVAALGSQKAAASVETHPTAAMEGPKLVNARLAAGLRGTDFPPAGTIYVGHSPAAVGAANYWGVANGGRWDWDTAPFGDSLQGWWPLRNVFNSSGGMTVPDWQRPWWSVDIGNNANYVINHRVANKRTFGVVGVWHRDDAGAPVGAFVNPAAATPAWAPLGPGFSAWMGLRAHGDVRFIDPETGNPFNSDVLQFNGINAIRGSGNDKHFPGYGSQMDQMLYRDFDMTGLPIGTPVTVTFTGQTNMSTERETAAAAEAGWFEIDPLQVTDGGAVNAAPGNFISATAPGPVLPVDALIVYLGAPAEGIFVGSDGLTRPIYDSRRRWLSEVIRIVEGFGVEIFRATGDTPPAVVGPLFVPGPVVDAMRAAGGNRLRVVFRVKTNRGFDDEGLAYSSCGQGAAVVDDVVIGFPAPATPPGFGDFEAAMSIDNDAGTSALDAWKSTGRPPGIYSHGHDALDLIYDDLCGPIGGPDRVCQMSGVVISMGDHDQSEAAGGTTAGAAERNLAEGIISPTIQLAAGATPNAMGLTSAQATATDDYYVDYEIYSGSLDLQTMGSAWRVGAQSYPAAQCDGNLDWGQLRLTSFVMFNSRRECFRDFVPLRGWGLIRTSNASGVPDSLRIYLGRIQQCFRFGLTVACSPTDGIYVDNIALAIVDGPSNAIRVEPWDWYQDTFPADENPALPGTALFDREAAISTTGRNNAPSTNDLTRLVDPADAPIVNAGNPAPGVTRVDLVFRILPGPGNYVILGNPASLLRALPGIPGVGVPGDLTNFWQNYMAFNGTYGTPGGHGIAWNPHVWNSARCDTVEQNIFAYQSRGIRGGPRDVGMWVATYHEFEPKGDGPLDVIPQLGTLRARCFVAAAAGPVDVLACGAVPAYIGAAGVPTPPCFPLPAPCPVGTTCPPAGPPPPGPPCGTGFDGALVTKEYTKIFPDDQFTPGTHVEYFFRKEINGGFAGMIPDTNLVFPQRVEENLDGHRWQQFSVVPDSWKEPAYIHPVTLTAGLGRATMLVVDHADRRGDEMAWVSAADTLGATLPARFGAHNGWHADGGQDVNDPAAFVRAHLGQPGTNWDLYQVRGGEGLDFPAGTIGSRLSARVFGSPDSRQAPTPEMLATYYRMLLLLTGDLSIDVLGPFPDRSQDDTALLSGWLASGSPITPDRGLWTMGDGLAQWLDVAGGPQFALLESFQGALIRDWNYRLLSLNTAESADLIRAGALPDLTLFNDCARNHDVLERSAALLPLTSDDAFYENVGASGPYVASVYKARTAISPWISRADGMALTSLVADGFVTPPAPQQQRGGPITAEFESPPTYLERPGRLYYLFKEMEQSFGVLGVFADIPAVPLGVPAPGGLAGDELRIMGNPSQGQPTAIEFALGGPGRVEARLFDVSGRLIRTLAHREFPAGPHTLVWDGSTETGGAAAPGVYLLRLTAPQSGLDRTVKLVRFR